MQVEILTDPMDHLGENPLWSEELQMLFWLDISRCKLKRLNEGGEVLETDLAQRPGSMAFLPNGELLLGMGDGIFSVDPVRGRQARIFDAPFADKVRFNEGKCDPTGRFWFGSMQNNFGPDGEDLPVEDALGGLYSFDGKDCHQHLGGIAIANTLAWSPKGDKLYFADSLQNAIYCFDFESESGAISNQSIFFQPEGLGLPDGSAMDREGCIWNARWGAAEIVRITPEGNIDKRISLPALQPTSCAFGGRDNKTLYVTTARAGLDENQLKNYPDSGAILAIDTGVEGMDIPAAKIDPVSNSVGKYLKR